ncbi:unnamed protein product [Notodromas monacha]|uniref:Palmitoyltransferase n=1 Tax=Notodromas monacha TaxID=399045 RepID=A0A7R9BK22_9CRUS|nr:unnamed protein product [Notodromas monacha]CAG0916915.1 unnamed protein product [Notodromas monacha]
MVNDHQYTLVRTTEWPPERYSDSEGPDSDLLSTDTSDILKTRPVWFPGTRTDMTSTVSLSSIKRWRLLPGRNRYFCDGRIMMAKQTGVFYFTVGLIVVTSGLFFGFDCPFLATRINPVLPLVAAVMFLFVMSTLFRTSFMDPGIIPRADSTEARDIEKQIEVQNGVSSPTYRPPPRTKEVVVNKVNVKLKYCFTCKIFRPPRASHCSICDNCVERFDHHCPWVGNCVGKRNYRFFYMFIVSLGFYCMFIFACVVTHLALSECEYYSPSVLIGNFMKFVYEKNQRFLDAVQESPASLIIAIICFLSVWSILGLAGFHTYLIFSNQTTNEDIKGSFSSRRGIELKNPYSKPGFCGNCFDILCGPFHPSLLRRRELVSWEEFGKNEAAVRNLDKEMSGAPVAAASIPASGPMSPSSGIPSSHPSYGTTEPAAQKKSVNGSMQLEPQSAQAKMAQQSASSGQYYPNPPPISLTTKQTRVGVVNKSSGGRTLPPLVHGDRLPSSWTSSLPRHHPNSGLNPSGDGFPPPPSSSSSGGFNHPDCIPHFAYPSQQAGGDSSYRGPPHMKHPTRRMHSFTYETEDDDADLCYILVIASWKQKTSPHAQSPKQSARLGNSQWPGGSTHPLLRSDQNNPHSLTTVHATDQQETYSRSSQNPTESVLDSLDLDSLDGSAGGTTLSSGSQAGLIIKNTHIL